ncbi:MAG: DNA polymerase III subunit gamma/tau, partial [bacterium]|nr:DNA polymerase III subunit gamma/tau [bacterium]
MSETLYRKHRPQCFADMVGQEHVRVTIQNQLKAGSVGHAYLFTGPRGVGKTTSARLLAKAVNCLNRGEGNEPCNTCDACNEVTEARSLDVVEMDAASNTGVDNVRENIIENVRFAPSSRKFKVFIIDEVHMLSTSAFNALLKTLEEPPAHAMFILATTEA